jgi:hypothetical protein
MAEHKHGEMDITDHNRTFGGFIRFTTWAVGIVLVLFVLMAIFIS